MKKWIIRAVLAALALVLTPILIFVLANSFDEELRPEVKQALEWKVPDGALGDNAYLIMLGMDAPADQDAMAVGREKLQAEIKRFEEARGTLTEAKSDTNTTTTTEEKAKHLDAWKDQRCDYATESNCVDFYTKLGAVKIKKLVSAQHTLLERYEAIKRGKNYIELVPPSINASFPAYTNLVNASELVRMQAITQIAAGNDAQGISMLRENAEFTRRLLTQSNTEISHLITVALIAKDTRILSELLVQFPRISAHTSEVASLLTSIAAPEYSQKKAMDSKLPMFLFVIQSVRSQLDTIALQEGHSQFLTRLQYRFFFQPNAALNLQYDATKSQSMVAEVPAHLITQTLQAEKEAAKTRMGLCIKDGLCLRNAMAKILVYVGNVSPVDYVQRQWDVEGYLRLVKLQLAIIQQKIPAEKIPTFLANAAPELRNPYTQQALTWNAEKRTIAFEGREESRAISTKPKNVFIANIPAQ